MKAQQPSKKLYVLAALFGNVPTMAFVFVLTFFSPSLLLASLLSVQILFFATMLSGAMLASYLIARKVNSYRAFDLGLMTGLFSYIVNILYSWFIYQEYMSLDIAWAFLAFVVGGVTGVMLQERLR